MVAAGTQRTRRILWPENAAPTPLDRVLRASLDDAPWAFCRRLVETGKVRVGGVIALDSRALVPPNTEVVIDPNAARPGRRSLEPVRLVFFDAQVVVADKPAGVSTVPYDPAERGTFDEMVHGALERVSHRRLPPLGVVHRIDKETSGLLVFARTTTAKRHLKQQFRFHTNDRIYLALALGAVRSQTIRSRLIEDRGDGRRGSTHHPTLGQEAITHVELVERLGSVSLVQCRLETGRTHQIRIHLAEAGHPLLGERVYGGHEARESAVLNQAPRLMLHAMRFAFTHPTREERLSFDAPLPDDFSQLVEKLRAPRR